MTMEERTIRGDRKLLCDYKFVYSVNGCARCLVIEAEVEVVDCVERHG